MLSLKKSLWKYTFLFTNIDVTQNIFDVFSNCMHKSLKHFIRKSALLSETTGFKKYTNCIIYFYSLPYFSAFTSSVIYSF